jgi:pimeloyl-ACP methyl ester carboxylesterase
MEEMRFTGERGLTITADAAGPESGLPVVLLHGGGQTRGSWKSALRTLASRGYRVFSLDARGHGDSDWDPVGDYSLDAQVADLRCVLNQLPPRPALVGASMGGVTALMLLGSPATIAIDARALVLVDVAPRVDPAGVERIVAFMRANPDGFKSVEEAANTVTAYNPHRPRPTDVSGLRRNLREKDGRLFWHWDPAFLGDHRMQPDAYRVRLEEATRRLTVPALLVRGSRSELVGDAEVAHFRALMPKAEFVEVADAGHMVAGDRNDAFNAAIINFLARIDRPCNESMRYSPNRESF